MQIKFARYLYNVEVSQRYLDGREKKMEGKKKNLQNFDGGA